MYESAKPSAVDQGAPPARRDLLSLVSRARMKPLPKDEQNPLANNASWDDLILWLAHRISEAAGRVVVSLPDGNVVAVNSIPKTRAATPGFRTRPISIFFPFFCNKSNDLHGSILKSDPCKEH